MRVKISGAENGSGNGNCYTEMRLKIPFTGDLYSSDNSMQNTHSLSSFWCLLFI